MSWGMVGAAAVGAAGSIGGGLLASNAAEGADVDDLLSTSFNAASDPLLSNLSYEDQLSLGVFDPGLAQQGSPLNRLNAALNSGTIGDVDLDFSNEFNRLVMPNIQRIIGNGIKKGWRPAEIVAQVKRSLDGAARTDPRFRRMFQSAMNAAGFGTFAELVKAELDFSRSFPSRQEGQALADAIRQGRTNARLTAAEIQNNLIAPTQQSFDDEVNRQQGLLNAAIMEQANTGGFNPAGRLQLSRNAAIDNALAFLVGQVGLQGGALQNALGSLAQQEAGGRQSANLRVNAGINQASTNAQQALGLAKLNQEANLDSAASLGNGFGGAGSILASLGAILAMNDSGGPASGGGYPGDIDTFTNPDGSVSGYPSR